MSSMIQPQLAPGMIVQDTPQLKESSSKQTMLPLGQVEINKLLNDLTAAAATLFQTTGKQDTANPGLPVLPEPNKAFSPADMVDLLRALREKSQEIQLRTAKHGLEAKQVDIKQNTVSQLKKIDEWISKCQEANRKSRVSSIFGWIGKIVAVVVAAVAVGVLAAGTIASGGGASPLLALAIIGLIGASVSLADQISQECGGPQISIGNLMENVIGKLLVACGVDEEKAASIGRMAGGAMALMCPGLLLIEPSLLGDLGAGIANLAGGDEQTAQIIGMALGITATIVGSLALIAINPGSSVSSGVRLTSQVVQGAGMVAAGVTQIGQGATSIEAAKFQADAQKSVADKNSLSAMMIKLMQGSEEDRAQLEKVMQEIQEGVRLVLRMINDSANSIEQINANIGRQAAV